MPARGILICLEVQSAFIFFLLEVFPWHLSYKKPGPATYPEVLLPQKQDNWWSMFNHPVH